MVCKPQILALSTCLFERKPFQQGKKNGSLGTWRFFFFGSPKHLSSASLVWTNKVRSMVSFESLLTTFEAIVIFEAAEAVTILDEN